MLYNCALNPLGAILGVSYGALADEPSTRTLMNQIVEEVFAVMSAAGYRTHWRQPQEFLDVFYGKLVPDTAGHKSSMLQDIAAGKRTEIEALNGAVLRLAREHGLEVPYNQAVYNLIKFIENSAMAGKRIDEHTLEVLEFEDDPEHPGVVRRQRSGPGCGRRALSFGGRALGRRPGRGDDRAGEGAGTRRAGPHGGAERHPPDPEGIRQKADGLRARRVCWRLPIRWRPAADCGCSSRIWSLPRAIICDAMGEKLGDFETTVDEIHRCIGGDKRVRDDASEKLREIRRQIAQLSENIHQRFMNIVASPALRKAIENDNFLMRHGRPVIAIKSNYRHVIRGTVVDRSNTGATLYVEPDELVELSNELEDAVFEEKKEVGRILWLLTKMVLDQQETHPGQRQDAGAGGPDLCQGEIQHRVRHEPARSGGGRVAAPAAGPPSAVAPVGQPAEELRRDAVDRRGRADRRATGR